MQNFWSNRCGGIMIKIDFIQIKSTENREKLNQSAKKKHGF